MGLRTFPNPVYRGENRVGRIVKPLSGVPGDQAVLTAGTAVFSPVSSASGQP